MKIIKAYQTSDGQLHQDKEAATRQEFMITIRGLFQSKIPNRETSMSTTFAANMIVNNAIEFRDAINTFQAKLRGIEQANSVKLNPVSK